MDDTREENVDRTWVFLNSVDLPEEATLLNSDPNVTDESASNHSSDTNSGGWQRVKVTGASLPLLEPKVDSSVQESNDQMHGESDIDSDGISIISEWSYSHTDDENIEDNPVQEEHESRVTDNNYEIGNVEVAPSCTPAKTNISTTSYPLFAQLARAKEPTQELTEQEFGSTSSDCEIETLGATNEIRSSEDSDERRLIELDTAEHQRNASEVIVVKKYLNGFLFGSILLALSSVFLGYVNVTQYSDKKLPLYQENLLEDFNEDDYEVPQALAFCREKFKSHGIFTEHNVQRCLKKIENHMKRLKEIKMMKEEMMNLKEQLSARESFLNEKEKYLAKKAYELGIKEELINQKSMSDEELYGGVENNPVEISKSIDAEQDFPQLPSKKYKRDTEYKSEFNFKKNEKKYSRDKFDKHYHEDGHKERKCKKGDMNKKDKRRKFKVSGDGKVINEIKSSDDHDISKKQKLQRKGKSDKRRYYETDAKKARNRQFKKLTERTEKNEALKHGNNNYVLIGKNDNDTGGGYWFSRLFQARSDMRNKEHSGEWYFNRVFYRKKKRDKARWYFDRMINRELMRYKRASYSNL